MFQVKKKGGFISFLCFTPFWKLIYLSFNGDFSIDWNLQKKEQKLKNITLICMLHSFIHSFIHSSTIFFFYTICLFYWIFLDVLYSKICVYIMVCMHGEGRPWVGVGVGLVCLCFLFFKSFNLWLLNFIFYVCILEIWFLFFLLILLVLTPIVSSCCFSFNASW